MDDIVVCFYAREPLQSKQLAHLRRRQDGRGRGCRYFKGERAALNIQCVMYQETHITQARLRQELQTLTRLPNTGAIMFSFKTYLTPIEEVKKEGCGLILADAIEGLKTGNAPGMWVYKGASRWGKSVCEYLRS